MSHILDSRRQGFGVFPFQHKDFNLEGDDLETRALMIGTRIIARDDKTGDGEFHSGAYQTDPEATGDFADGMFWRPGQDGNSRNFGAWRMTFPAIVTFDPNAEGKMQVKPIFDSDYEADDRFRDEEFDVKNLMKAAGTTIKKGDIGLALIGTDELKQRNLFLPIGTKTRLVAANRPFAGGNFALIEEAVSMGTEVYDLIKTVDPTTGITGLALDEENPARLQSMMRVLPGPILDQFRDDGGPSNLFGVHGPTNRQVLAWNMAATGYLGNGHQDYAPGLGAFFDVATPPDMSTGSIDPATLRGTAVGLASWIAGGPFSPGGLEDHHMVGASIPVLDEDGNDRFLSYNSGHLHYKSLFYVGQNFDAPLPFSSLNIEQATNAYIPYWGTIRHVPNVNHFTTTGEHSGMWYVVTTGWDSRGDMGVGRPPGVNAEFDGPSNRLAPYVKNRKIQPWENGDAPVNFVYTAHARAFPAWLGRPQDLREGEVDFRFSSLPPLDQHEIARQTFPIVFNMEAFAGQGGVDGTGTHYGSDQGWRHTQPPGTGRYLGGTASGGYVIMSPEFDLLDLGDEGFSSPSAPVASEVHVIAAPGTYFGAGLPDKIEGKMHRGYRWGVDTGTPLELRFKRATDRAGGALSFLDQFLMREAESVFNEGQLDIDFRVESDINAYGLYLDGQKGVVGVGVNTSYGSYPGWGPTTIEDGSADVAGNQRVGGLLDVEKEFQTRANTPTQLTADVNDLDLGRTAVHRMSSDADRTVTGIAQSFSAPVTTTYNGLHKILINIGSFNIVLSNEDAASTAANRIITETGVNLTIMPGRTVWLNYDSTALRWRVIAGTATTAPLVEVTKAAFTADQHDYAIGAGDFFRLSTDAVTDYLLTGIAGGSRGRTIYLLNLGPKQIKLENQNASSAAANRIITGTGSQIVLDPDDIHQLLFDFTTSRWRAVP